MEFKHYSVLLEETIEGLQIKPQGIYVDVLLTVNFLVDYLLLAAVEILRRRQFSRKRLVLGALLGAAGSLSIFLPEMALEIRWLWQFLLAGLMCRCSARWQGWRSFLGSWVLLYGVSFLMGGAMLALRLTLGQGWMFLRNGVVYFHISPGTLVISVGAGFAAVELYQRLFPDRNPQGQQLEAQLWLLDRNICCKAFVDTGNFLREPFSGWPVVLLERRLFPGNIPEHCLRMIPYKTVGGTALLPAVKGQRLRLKELDFEAERFYVAFSPETLDGACPLLLSAALMNRK